MNKVLLWGQPSSKTKGGAEQFVDLLRQAVPELKVVYPDPDSVPAWPFLSEPAKAKAAATSLMKQLHTLKPEVVLYNGMFGYFLPSKTSFRKIALCHGTFPSFARHAMKWGVSRIRTEWVYAYFEKMSYANADKIICNSTYTKNNLANDYGLKGDVISLATSIPKFRLHQSKLARKNLRLPADKKIVLFVGRPTWDKGFDMVEEIAQRHPEWHVVAITNPKGHSSCVDCRGPLSFEDILPYYAACDVVFFPTRYESFGYVTIESLAAEKPVVTTPFGVAQEITHPYCITVPTYTIEAFEQGILQAIKLKSPPNMKSLLTQYDLPRFQREYQKILGETK